MTPSAKKSRRNRLLQGLSLIAVLAIMLYVLASIVPPDQAAGLSLLERLMLALKILLEAVAGARVGAMVLLSVVYFIFLLLMDSASTRWVIERFNCPLTLQEMIPARAITFLLAVINYQAGQLGIPLFLKRTRQVPVVDGMASIVFIGALDLAVVFLMATIGALFIPDGNMSKEILAVGLIGLGGYGLNALFWRYPRSGSGKILEKLAHLPGIGKVFNPQQSIFKNFTQATLRDYLIIFCLRAPIHMGILFTMYLMIICFHAHVPLLQILIYFPVVMLISIIPVINVGAVGASQGAVVYFFKDYAPEASLFAASIVWLILLSTLKVLLGALYLTRYSAALFKPTDNLALDQPLNPT